MIDTYVYFVSYKAGNDDTLILGDGCCSVKLNKEVKSWEDIEYIREYLKEMDKMKTLIINNFQLLDSYNKEEREGKDGN